MSNQLDRKQFLLAIFGLLIILAGATVTVWTIWKTLTSVSPQVGTALVAGMATLLVSVFSVLWSKRVDREREIEQEQRQQKIPVYEDFLSLIFRIVFAEKLGENPVSEQEMLKIFRLFAQKLLVWGSDEVLKEYATWRRITTSSVAQENPVFHLFAIERLLFAIRKDVGHKNKNLKQGDLLSIFVNDIDHFLEPRQQLA